MLAIMRANTRDSVSGILVGGQWDKREGGSPPVNFLGVDFWKVRGC